MKQKPFLDEKIIIINKMSNLNTIQSATTAATNLVNAKKKVNSIFVVPTATTSSQQQPHSITPTTPSNNNNNSVSSSQQIITIQKNNAQQMQFSQNSIKNNNNNKITVIPINLNNNINLNTTKTVTSPIKVISSVSSSNNITSIQNNTSPLNPLNTNTKKIVINNNTSHITKTIGSVNNSNTSNDNTKQVHVVKIINTPSNSSGIKIATLQHQNNNNNNGTSALASLLNTSDLPTNPQQSLKLHTYQINKQPKLATHNIYVQPMTASTTNHSGAQTTVIHKMPTQITKTISSNVNLATSSSSSSSIGNKNPPQISTVINYKTQNENNVPSSTIHQNVRPQITVISANSNHKIVHNTITNSSNSNIVNNNHNANINLNLNSNVNQNKNNNSNNTTLLNESYENDNILDTDAIKLIVNLFLLFFLPKNYFIRLFLT